MTFTLFIEDGMIKWQKNLQLQLLIQLQTISEKKIYEDSLNNNIHYYYSLHGLNGLLYTTLKAL